MNYEEKYKNALAKAREIYRKTNVVQKGLLENLFPELAESENEKIRKALIELVKFSKKSCFEILKDQSFNIVSMDAMLAWLEKQVEQKSGWNEDDERIRKELIDAIQGLWDNDALPLPLSVKRKNAWLAWLEKQSEKVTMDKQKFDCNEEDDRIKKALIDLFSKGAEYGAETNGVCDKDIITWLEKQ